ncbi:probable receptor-like protein kinase At5g24010 [Rutidosis leptorrhynchoides]|uniref:probable receptor-like protein kinase At5g24010 n=1 Tax=Rutidosis leptorrhynchoides TaxID=125765 RepID=UPI003A98D4FE
MSIQIKSLLFILLAITVTVVSAFYPADHYLIDCGTTASTTTVDVDHRIFTGDGSSLVLSSTKSVALHDSKPDPNFSPIYHTARVFMKPSHYSFKIKEKGTHLVRIHFHRFDFSNTGSTCHDQFHVSANGYVLLHNFSISKGNPRIKDFMISVDDDDDELVIRFIPVDKSSFAYVNAIEVISAPKDLIPDEYVKHAYETVYRVSVGGVKVTPFNDSLWRNWVPDDEFLKTSDGSLKSYSKFHFGGRIQYRLGGASREVGPDNMYNSARIISSLNDSIPKVNMTWVFPVRKGFSYLVRLHFCDIASLSVGMIYFNVYVNGDLVYENLDLSALTNYMLASPFYADFVVDSEKISDVIRVDIGPSSLSRSHAVDGILNGLEIWKMDNSMKSLDGEVSANQLESKNQSGGQLGRLLSLSGAVCLLAIAFLFMRRKTEAKNSAGWSRVPVDVSEIDLKSNYPKSTVVNV